MRPLPVALLIALLAAAVAHAAADLERGRAALEQAYEQSEGDEGGHESIVVDQCRVESESVVRCVVVHESGHSNDLPTEDYHEQRVPLDYAVATFGSDDSITTSREPFEETPKALDADIRIRDPLRRRPGEPLTVSVSPDVRSTVRVRAWIGAREIRRRPGTPERTVEVPSGERTAVALRLSRAQRVRVRRRLRDGGSVRAVVLVRVDGDVGPAIAGETRVLGVRVTR